MLWFDVGIETYTTTCHYYLYSLGLWFDVGIQMCRTTFITVWITMFITL